MPVFRKTALVFLAAAGLLQAAQKFEVASIRPCVAADLGARTTTVTSAPATLHLPCLSVRALIERAYLNWAGGRLHVWPPKIAIEGAPSWTDSSRYRIEAKPETPQRRGIMNGPMLQALLEDRFKLSLHREVKEVPVYALTVAKSGPKLQPSREGSCIAVEFDNLPPPTAPGQPEPVFCGMSEVTEKGYKLFRTTIADFATEFSARLDRPVVDKTGIAGTFDIHLNVSPADLYPNDSTSDPYAVFDAVRVAVQKLGLKLDRAKGPGEFLIIDHVERPSEN